MLRLGQKVRTKPNAFQSVTGYVVRLDSGYPDASPFAVIYCGKYESVKVPQCDLIPCETPLGIYADC